MERKGQFIYNELRQVDVSIKDMRVEDYILRQKAMIADKLWNMSDTEFDKIIKEIEGR